MPKFNRDVFRMNSKTQPRTKRSAIAKQVTLDSFFQFYFITLTFLFLLTLGSDISTQKALRMSLCTALLLPIIAKPQRIFSEFKLSNLAILFFFGMVSFQFLRVLYFFSTGRTGDDSFFPLYVESLKRWGCYFIMFVAGAVLFRNKKSVNMFSLAILGGTFFISVNAIPALLMFEGRAGYEAGEQIVFFYPYFYFNELIGNYVLGKFAHPNYTGDLVSIGFFVGMGGFFYLLNNYRERKNDLDFDQEERRNAVAAMSLRIFVSIVSVAAVVLFFSRGTILSFALVSLTFLLIIVIKIRSVAVTSIVVVFLLGAIGFLSWSTNLGAVWKELQTLEREVDAESAGSFDTNKEGIHRALGMYADHKLWGVGTRGYKKLAEQYATEGSWDKLWFARVQSMCHYVHTLAEEGAGAYFYFLFILCFLLSGATILLKTGSQYKFILCLAMISPVVMVFLHASFNHLMQRFSMSMIIYSLMGVSMGLFRKDFKHG